MPEPEVELYDDQQYQISSEASGRRLAAARARARRLRRLRAIGLALLFLIVPIAVAGAVVAARAPGSPFLVVTWAKPKVPQVLASNSAVLARGGQPFEVSITNPQRWNVMWKSGGSEQKEGNFKWAPAEGSGELTAVCEPRAQGWESYFSFLWPQREVSISSAKPKSGGNYARQITTGAEGVWIYPHIFADGAISWDERTLPLIADAAAMSPENRPEGKTAPLRAQPTGGLWRIVSNFDGETNLPSENGTFASYHGPDLENALPLIAARIVKQSPAASVKFVLRLDRDPAQGIIRVAFDGKRERQAWIRRKGDAKGQPFTGWEDGNFEAKAPQVASESQNDSR